jgi:microcystin-dependent protein
MDRQIVYPGAIPLETDLLNTNKNVMIGLAKLAAAILGTSTFMNGLACTPDSPASLNVKVAPGEIYSLQNIDGTAYSSLAADTAHSILKQGIMLDSVLLSCPAPATNGQSINYLIQVAYQDTDANAVVLPYYNASNPAQAYSGPNNSGSQNYTTRKGVCTVSAKAGVAATTGSQTTPAPDAGYIGAFVVTVAYGQTQILAGNISAYGGAPFLPSAGLVVGGLQGNACNISAADGTADAITGSYTPGISALTNGMTLYVRAGSANATTTPTFTPNSGTIAAKTIVKGNGLALAAGDIAGGGHWIELQYDLTLDKWVLLNPATGVSTVTQQPGEICIFARNTAPTGFLKANGAAISRASYAALFAALVKSSTATISIASPGVVTWNNHGLSANDPVKFTTTGALPTGLTTGTTYYVVGASITTNTFQLSETAGGTAINTSGSQSGTHTAINAPFGDGDGSTTFNVPDLRGEFLRGWDDSRAVDASRTFGSAQAADIAPHEHSMPWRASGSFYGGTGSSYTAVENAAGGSTNNSTGTETRPRNIALLACIKY